MAGSGYKDYFVPGAERGADANSIKRARKLARQYHPDVNPGISLQRRDSRRSVRPTRFSPIPTNAVNTSTGQYWNQAGSMGGPHPGYGC